MTSALENAMRTIVQVFHDYVAIGDCLEFDGFNQLMKENCSLFVSTTCPPHMPEDQYLRNLFTDTDTDHDGCITFFEFCTIMAKVMLDEHNYSHSSVNAA